MCGIAGVIDFRHRPIPERQLANMATAIRHRGPDDEGLYHRRGVGFAFRRLAILDLSADGHQPMLNRDKSLVIIFNGEIYNYRELRARLIRKGYRFYSQTDTEVVLQAYAEYGPACVDHLNGMFAFAVHDVRRRLVFFARDRFGIKPFYYTVKQRRLSFGSEVKALLTLPEVHPGVDLEALNEYFTFQNVLSERTLFDGVRILPPGMTMTVSESGAIEQNEYWDPVPEPMNRRTNLGTVYDIRSTFESAVQRHMMADVPVGSQLSGGIDSASIVAVAARGHKNFQTFTGGFDVELAEGLEMNFDERADAELVAQANKTQHYNMVIRPGDMERILPKLIWHQEDLRVGNSYPNYFICQLASKFVKVVHSGTGGDELFGGYAWRYNLIADARDPEDFDRKFYGYWQRLLNDEQRQRIFTPRVLSSIDVTASKESYRHIVERHTHLSPIDRALYFEMKTFLHGLLSVEDKVSSAHSIEVRVPFLDHELVKLALSIPARMKTRNGAGKVIFRKAIEPLVPAAIFNKKKQGFSAPEHLWFRRSLKLYVYKMLLGRSALNRHYLRPSVVEDILQQHLDGANHRLLIWSLLSFEWWLRLYHGPKAKELQKSIQDVS